MAFDPLMYAYPGSRINAAVVLPQSPVPGLIASNARNMMSMAMGLAKSQKQQAPESMKGIAGLLDVNTDGVSAEDMKTISEEMRNAQKQQEQIVRDVWRGKMREDEGKIALAAIQNNTKALANIAKQTQMDYNRVYGTLEKRATELGKAFPVLLRQLRAWINTPLKERGPNPVEKIFANVDFSQKMDIAEFAKKWFDPGEKSQTIDTPEYRSSNKFVKPENIAIQEQVAFNTDDFKNMVAYETISNPEIWNDENGKPRDPKEVVSAYARSRYSEDKSTTIKGDDGKSVVVDNDSFANVRINTSPTLNSGTSAYDAPGITIAVLTGVSKLQNIPYGEASFEGMKKSNRGVIEKSGGVQTIPVKASFESIYMAPVATMDIAGGVVKKGEIIKKEYFNRDIKNYTLEPYVNIKEVPQGDIKNLDIQTTYTKTERLDNPNTRAFIKQNLGEKQFKEIEKRAAKLQDKYAPKKKKEGKGTLSDPNSVQ